MKRSVTVYGTNYTGAHFRGFEDPNDELYVKIRLTGCDIAIARFITDNFSYSEEVEGLNDLISLHCHDKIPRYEGCGALIAIIGEDGVPLVIETHEGMSCKVPKGVTGNVVEFLDTHEIDWCSDGAYVETRVLDLGEIDLGEVIDDQFNTINHLVDSKLKA